MLGGEILPAVLVTVPSLKQENIKKIYSPDQIWLKMVCLNRPGLVHVTPDFYHFKTFPLF
jgi:hypothetical protein